ncbi:MAG TPA: MFS transporter [Burkholderiales bacterium]|nr:MFS transporter [Burkholderiales bacterium]
MRASVAEKPAMRPPWRLACAVFLPFAAGYFLSFFFRNVNAVISKDLARELALAPSDLGFLTSMYLLAFAAFQLPLGILLDRFGARRVCAVLMCVAAAGALVFAWAHSFAALSLGRALIGLGVSAGLMGALKAFINAFPASRLATMNGLILATGGLGGLAATVPAEVLVARYGWRELFEALSALSVFAAGLIFFLVPEKRVAPTGEPLASQIASFGTIFRSGPFWRLVLPVVACLATYQALQGLWLGPWLYDVAGEDRRSVANYLLLSAAAYTAGSAFFGVTADRLARRGIPRMVTATVGACVALAMCCLLAAQVTVALGAILFFYGFTAISGTVAYAELIGLFPPAMTGRVMTAYNVVNFFSSFAFQWGIGEVLKLYPVSDGRYAAAGYGAAFLILALLQAAALAWMLASRGKA